MSQYSTCTDYVPATRDLENTGRVVSILLCCTNEDSITWLLQCSFDIIVNFKVPICSMLSTYHITHEVKFRTLSFHVHAMPHQMPYQQNALDIKEMFRLTI